MVCTKYRKSAAMFIVIYIETWKYSYAVVYTDGYQINFSFRVLCGKLPLSLVHFWFLQSIDIMDSHNHMEINPFL